MLEYTALFLAGFLGSLHCIGMCGGFVAAYSLKLLPTERKGLLTKVFPHLLFNGGRLVSYTLIGALLGSLGSLFNFLKPSDLWRLRPLLAGGLILLLGLQLLGVLPSLGQGLADSLPARLAKKGAGRFNRRRGWTGAFFVGLPIGLLPCGLLFPVQVKAASTGSALEGSLTMVLFGLGTIPALVLLGMASHLLHRIARLPLLKMAGLLFVLMGAALLLRGMGLSLPLHAR